MSTLLKMMCSLLPSSSVGKSLNLRCGAASGPVEELQRDGSEENFEGFTTEAKNFVPAICPAMSGELHCPIKISAGSGL